MGKRVNDMTLWLLVFLILLLVLFLVALAFDSENECVKYESKCYHTVYGKATFRVYDDCNHLSATGVEHTCIEWKGKK